MVKLQTIRHPAKIHKLPVFASPRRLDGLPPSIYNLRLIVQKGKIHNGRYMERGG